LRQRYPTDADVGRVCQGVTMASAAPPIKPDSIPQTLAKPPTR